MPETAVPFLNLKPQWKYMLWLDHVPAECLPQFEGSFPYLRILDPQDKLRAAEAKGDAEQLQQWTGYSGFAVLVECRTLKHAKKLIEMHAAGEARWESANMLIRYRPRSIWTFHFAANFVRLIVRELKCSVTIKYISI